MIAVVIIVSLAVNGKTEKEEVNTTASYSSSVIKFTNAAETTQSISKWQNSSELATQQSSQSVNSERSESSESQSKSESKSEDSEHEQSQEPNENSINNSSHNSSQSNNNYYRPQQSETPKPEPTKVQEPKPTVKPQETTKDNIYLSYSSVSIHTDDVLFLNLIGADNGVSWSVGNSYILQNYGGGGNQCSFKALKKGSTTVTAAYNGRSYTCYVTVN